MKQAKDYLIHLPGHIYQNVLEDIDKTGEDLTKSLKEPANGLSEAIMGCFRIIDTGREEYWYNIIKQYSSEINKLVNEEK